MSAHAQLRGKHGCIVHKTIIHPEKLHICPEKLRIPGVDPGFGQGEAPGPQAESCWCSEASNFQLGSRACLRALEAFGFLMLKYAFSNILETLFL